MREGLKRIGRAAMPWLVLSAVAAVAVWHVIDYSEPIDGDFPKVIRPFFNSRPPAAYRLAEPGDTLDRIGLYVSACVSAIALVTIALRLRSKTEGTKLGLWPTALTLAMAATWHASTPGPTFDGWHGWGWRTIFDPLAPTGFRVALATLAIIFLTLLVVNVWRNRVGLMSSGREFRIRGLLATAAVLVAMRQFDFLGIEPVGYWPRCAFDIGMIAFGLALLRCRPLAKCEERLRTSLAVAAAFGLLVAVGMLISSYHRPLSRLHAVVPGRIYISAMPSYRSLSIEQERLHFRTIINLFDEASTQASPYHKDELRFVREHGLRYLGSPSDGLESDRFLDETLALARNPDAWPILIHCHGCMDRSPAWMGIYRFVVEGKPLNAIFREIERHRGSRPKPVVMLQYNRKLPMKAPERFATDPTAQLLARCVAGTRDPFLRPNWNSTVTGRRVVTRIEPDLSIRRP